MPRLPTGFKRVYRTNKDGTKRSYVRARVYKYDENEKRKRISIYGRTREQVEIKMREIQNRRVASFDASEETVAGYLNRWLKRIEAENAYRTHELYCGIVTKHITGHIGSIRLIKLKPREIGELLNHTLRNVGSRTRQLVYRVLHYALESAIADEVLFTNPCLTKFKPKHKYAQFRSLTSDEVHTLLQFARDGDHYTLLYLALATGMRQGELFGLRWDAVNLENCFLSVCGTLAKNHDGKLSLQRPKGKRDRRIELSPFTVELLKKHRKRQYPLSPWVFSDTNGNPMQKDNFGHRIFRPLLRKAGIERIRFHDLRHSSATLYLAAGENIKVVQERLGHASAKMTLDVYAKAVPTLQKEGAERMDSILSPDGDTRWGHVTKLQDGMTKKVL